MAAIESASDYSLAIVISKSVELQDVLLKEVRATAHASRDQILEAIPWTIDYGTSSKFTFDETAGLLKVCASLSATLSAKSASSHSPLLTVECTFDLRYLLAAKGPTPEDRSLQAFANVNGVYNVWPYFRELVHSMAARMGLPPIIIPVHRVSITRNAPASASIRSQAVTEKRI